MPNKRVGEYKLIKKLASGPFSSVWKGINDDDDIVAIKIISKGKLNKKLTDFLDKNFLLENLEHNNIIHLINMYKTSNHIYLIFEYCLGGDLSLYINKLEEYQIKIIIKQIILGLLYCQKKYILHRDLKPQNILLTEDLLNLSMEDFNIFDDIVKISDFDFAKILRPFDMTSTICGSPLYMAPEIIKGDNYNNKADIWSLGIITYELLVGKVPYESDNIIKMLKVIEQSDLLIPETLSVDAKDFLKKTLNKTSYLRPSYETLLEHPFFNSLIEIKSELSPTESNPILINSSAKSKKVVKTEYNDFTYIDTPISVHNFQKRREIYNIRDSIITFPVPDSSDSSDSSDLKDNNITKMDDILFKGNMIQEIAVYHEEKSNFAESLLLYILNEVILYYT